jgi:hypothetical protein
MLDYQQMFEVGADGEIYQKKNGQLIKRSHTTSGGLRILMSEGMNTTEQMCYVAFVCDLK